MIKMKPFTTDGCSGGIYKMIFKRDPPWQDCCLAHDLRYWYGGTKHNRRQADATLYHCVKFNGHPLVALAMWCGVRIGGHPIWPFSWRWGYGRVLPTWYDK